MAKDVKTRRYDNTQRRDGARQTKRAIVLAAAELFVELGYPATTLSAIAARAGVSVQTVYAQFGNKSTVLKEVIDQTVAGDDEPQPLRERDWVHRILAEPDPRKKIALHAHGVTAIMARAHQLHWVLRSAAPVDEDAAAQWEKGVQQRRSGMRELAAHLHDVGRLRADLTIDQATDRISALIDPELYRLTVQERHWTPEQYEKWLTELLIASLLTAARATR